MKKIIIFLCLLVFYTLTLMSQQILPPSENDPNWTRVFYDEFDNLDLSMWRTSYPWNPETNNGLEINLADNIDFTGGKLRIKADRCSPNCIGPNGGSYQYSGGVLYGLTPYLYGYFEILAKAPLGKGYWPAFWIFGGGPALPGDACDFRYEEIDIFELGLETYLNSNEIGTNFWWTDWLQDNPTKDGYCFVNQFNEYVSIPMGSNITEEHKYGVLWDPEKITYFIDDIPVRTVFDSQVNQIPIYSKIVILNFAIDPYYVPFNTATFPAFFEISYLKIFQLKADCQNDIDICNFDMISHSFKQQKSIQIGGDGCQPIINTFNNAWFKATDFIQINEGTTLLPSGAGACTFTIEPCPF